MLLLLAHERCTGSIIRLYRCSQTSSAYTNPLHFVHSLVAHLYSSAHQAQPSVTLELSGLTAKYEQTGGSAMGRRGSVRFAQLLLQLHDSLQASSTLAVFTILWSSVGACLSSAPDRVLEN